MSKEAIIDIYVDSNNNNKIDVDFIANTSKLPVKLSTKHLGSWVHINNIPKEDIKQIFDILKKHIK